MQWVNICLHSGKLATEACSKDVRLSAPLAPNDFITTSMTMVYPEDAPTEYCDKHVLVDYCSGGGVATDACKALAKTSSSVKITSKALVKMNQTELNSIVRAESYGLIRDYLRNDYVYFVNADGSDGWFKGVKNNLSQKVKAPYKVCPVHG